MNTKRGCKIKYIHRKVNLSFLLPLFIYFLKYKKKHFDLAQRIAIATIKIILNLFAGYRT